MARESEMKTVQRYLFSDPPVDVISLIRELGIEYREQPLGPENSGRIDRNNGEFVITVNSEESPQRRRFTAAHELAHYLLHRDLLKHGHADRLFGAGARHNATEPFTSGHEVQANKYAADILMPKAAIDRVWQREADNFAEVARKFGVSMKAMKIRLNNLGLRATAD
ncbi:ImmA/IrrE family metallo-endopeptidase [Pseudoroseicyclus aestuarii]|uniref:ImmA/IrrE family metallo-endopeptidase n=1 Tax=Pseudoroseicyclus aestuarii TaxID=1795041 RepID=UPI0015E88A4B|nr:ImmA/IrrE family metallo-endopeptidase [Pseudoroseicyclus aestuarii]